MKKCFTNVLFDETKNGNIVYRPARVFKNTKIGCIIN